MEILEAHISGDYYSTISLMEQRQRGLGGDTAEHRQRDGEREIDREREHRTRKRRLK